MADGKLVSMADAGPLIVATVRLTGGAYFLPRLPAALPGDQGP